MNSSPTIYILENLPCEVAIDRIKNLEEGAHVQVRCESYSPKEKMDILAALLCRDPVLVDGHYVVKENPIE